MYYPKNSASFQNLENFSKQFDGHVSQTIWSPVTDGDEISISKELIVMPLRNGHVPVDQHIIKSLGYLVMQTRKKLKPEFSHLSGQELRQLSEQHGKDFLSYELRHPVLGYSGDTPVEDGSKWNHTDILIHEATFLESGAPIKARGYGNKHSTLEEVMEMVSAISIGQLILGHFSSRYQPEEIDRAIKQQCEKYTISFPVRRILPGVTVHDVLSQPPLNQ